MRRMRDLDIRDAKGRTALHVAVEQGNSSIVRLLTMRTNGKKEELPICVANINAQDKEGSTPLHIAILRRDGAIMKTLLQIPDIDIEVKDASGHTPLHCAILAGLENVVEILLAKGADLNTRVG